MYTTCLCLNIIDICFVIETESVQDIRITLGIIIFVSLCASKKRICFCARISELSQGLYSVLYHVVQCSEQQQVRNCGVDTLQRMR